MRLHRFLHVLWFLAVCSSVSAADLPKTERRIAREPAYRSKPKYCLLVFGPQAKTRIWLVQDGDTLYVDRNGDGDLTGPGKAVTAGKHEAVEPGQYTFKVDEIRDGARLHKELIVYTSKIDYLADQEQSVKSFLAKNPGSRGYGIFCQVEMPGWKGAGIGGRIQQRVFYLDSSGVFQFADKPRNAPVVHFGGPWQVALFSPQRLTLGREPDLVLGVGTPGIGPGTTAWIDYDGVIPEKVYPTLDITYPPRQPGEPPVREHHELKRRC